MKNSGFNPKARWDRNIPETNQSTSDCLDEKIEVLAWFKNAKAYPQIFVWKNKEYEIKNITYNWQERSGEAIINYFSVSTGSDLYQISFNNTTFGWKLDKVID